MKILVVDDEYTSLMILNHLLKPYGECNSATNGKQAFTMFKKAYEESKPYDLITLDLEMPEMRGDNVAKSIRLWERVNQSIVRKAVKMFIVTSKDDKLSKFLARQKGCDGFLVKPISKESISDALENFNILV